MTRVIQYEHRGQLYRQLVIRNQADAAVVAHMFRNEQDVWLKKLLASKLQDVIGTYDLELSEADIREAIKCRIK